MTFVVGTKLEPSSEPVAEVAARLAHRLGEGLRLVHVCRGARAQAIVGTADEASLLGAERGALEAEAARLRDGFGVNVRSRLAAEPMVDALITAASAELAWALVVGASTRPLAAIPERLTERSPVPVLALRDPSAWMAWLDGERPLKILVGADPGRSAQAARAWAVRLAAVGPVETEVVYVELPGRAHERLGLPPPDADDHSAEARDVLLRALADAAPVGEAATLEVVADGRGVAAALAEHAAPRGFDLVVVGRRSRAGAAWWRRSTARGVLRAIPTSVACVPSPVGEVDASFRPPHDVVVGLDLDAFDHPALTHALGYAAEGGTVHVAHVLAPSPGGRSGLDREDAWRRITQRIAAIPRPPSLTITPHLLEGTAAEALLALAERVDADLIVAGARNRPIVSRVLVGSVARALISSSRRPLLLVPAASP